MPSPLQGSWLWPANRGARAASGPRDQAAVPRDHTFDKLFDAEEQRRRRARSQSSRRSEKVFPAPRRAEAVRAEHRSQPVQGPSLREAAAAAREAALRVEPPERRPLPGRAEELGPGERLVLGLDCDEVLPGLLLANGRTVKAVAYMRELRVTHVINTASRDVWLPSEKLSNIGIDLFQFHVDDVPSANIAPFFRPVADMVRRVEETGGLLVVNCLVGLSRSATVLAAALIITRHWSLARTLRCLRTSRQVKPNLGFMAQLVTLESDLRKRGIKLM